MMAYPQPQDDGPDAPRAYRALYAQAIKPGAAPTVLAAARVLDALCTAAAHIGGDAAHVQHWITNSPDLSRPRLILGARRLGARAAHPGRLVAADLAAYDVARPEDREAVREIITHALTTGATA